MSSKWCGNINTVNHTVIPKSRPITIRTTQNRISCTCYCIFILGMQKYNTRFSWYIIYPAIIIFIPSHSSISKNSLSKLSPNYHQCICMTMTNFMKFFIVKIIFRSTVKEFSFFRIVNRVFEIVYMLSIKSFLTSIRVLEITIILVGFVFEKFRRVWVQLVQAHSQQRRVNEVRLIIW